LLVFFFPCAARAYIRPGGSELRVALQANLLGRCATFRREARRSRPGDLTGDTSSWFASPTWLEAEQARDDRERKLPTNHTQVAARGVERGALPTRLEAAKHQAAKLNLLPRAAARPRVPVPRSESQAAELNAGPDAISALCDMV
jgi:hypothetical protein